MSVPASPSSFDSFPLVTRSLPPQNSNFVIETKLEAVRCYETQMLYQDYVPAVLGLDAYRSLFLERGATYGEGFIGRYREGSSY